MNKIQRKSPFWSLAGPFLLYLVIQLAVQTIIEMVVSMPCFMEFYWQALAQSRILTLEEWLQLSIQAMQPALEVIASYQVEITGVSMLATFALTVPLFIKDRKLEKMCGGVSPVSISPGCVISITVFGLSACVAVTCLMAMAQFALYDAEYVQDMAVVYGAGVPVQILVLGLLVPVGEELMFRGLLFRRFRENGSFWYSALSSSFFFAFMHTNATQMIYAFLLGLMLCYLYEKTGTFTAPILLHMVMNTGSVILTVTGGFRWIGEDPMRMAAATILGAFFSSVAFVLLQRMLDKQSFHNGQ